jgi:kynurenine formamidase
MGQNRIIDLSHTIEHGMTTYKGLPAPIICDFLSREESRSRYAEGTEFQIGKIEMVANTGTYIDSPFHRYDNGIDIAELNIASLADLECVVVRTMKSGQRAINRDAFRGVSVKKKAVLIQCGWDVHWRTGLYFEGHPFLTEDAAKFLADEGAQLVGIDSYNIDSIDDGNRPVHTTLLGAGIPIVEHMCGLHALPDSGARFHAVPAKVKGMGSFPVRAYAVI